MRRTFALAAMAVAALVPAACGGDDDGEEATPPPTTSPAAGQVYERSYTECASTELDLLAGKYRVTPSRAAIAEAVGAAWADRVGGGQQAAEAGAAGCQDGFQARISESSN